MEKNIEIELIKERIKKLRNSNKNLKCPGVLRKLERKLYKLENE